MNRRQLFRLLPLATVAATTIKIDNTEARVHELAHEKKYLVVIPNLEAEDGPRLASGIRKRLGENVAVIGGTVLADMKVYELP